MSDGADGRVDSASRVISAPPNMVYHAFIDPKALLSWLPPEGMRGEIYEFEPRVDGRYRMALIFEDRTHATAGKTSEHRDVVQGRFLELVPGERIVQLAEFESADPAFAGTMKMTWTFTAVPRGTEVGIVCENVPTGITAEDHDAGLRSSLENLAAYIE